MKDMMCIWLWFALCMLSVALGVAWAFTDNTDCLLWAILYGVWAGLGRPD